MASIGACTFDDQQRIPHTIAILKKIQQPSNFVRFIERKEEEFDAGLLTNYQSFTNDVVVQYQKLKDDDTEGKFRGS